MERHSPAISRSRAIQRRAFTLAECLIASVILTVGVLGASGALSAASSQTKAMDVDARSLAIARQVIEEIAARPFDVDPNEQESAPNCIDDYNGIDRVTIALVSDATSVADTITYTTHVAVQHRSSPAGGAVVDGDLALITVTTTPSAKGAAVTLHRLVSRYTQVRG